MKKTKQKNSPFWFIIIIVVAVIVFVAINSGDSSGLEKDLIETLPIELRTYLWNENIYELDDEGNCIEHILNIKDLTVERHSTEGSSDIADCTIVMEDEYIEKTVYVTLHSMKYNTGWVVERWEELQEPTVVPKFEPDVDYLKNLFDFKNITVTEDNLSLAEGKYIYSYNVNDSYKYVDFRGEVILKATFSQSYNYSDELYVYAWYYGTDDSSTIKADWKVEGTWTIGVSQNDLVNEKGILNISYLNNDVTYSSMDSRHYGKFTGSASYFDANYYSMFSDPARTFTFDFSNQSGWYDVYGMDWSDNTFNPADLLLKVDGGDYIRMEFTRDNVRAYLDGQECYYVYQS